MQAASPRERWQQIYINSREDELSWFEAVPAISLELLLTPALQKDVPILDVGGGASHLADALLDRGFTQLTVLDIAHEALQKSKLRLAGCASQVRWVTANITQWVPDQAYGTWHDRAVFHFLTTQQQRLAYRATLEKAILPGGIVVIGTFALNGPQQCSGLPVQRYSQESLAAELGPAFRWSATRHVKHIAPAGQVQHFQFSRFVREQVDFRVE